MSDQSIGAALSGAVHAILVVLLYAAAPAPGAAQVTGPVPVRELLTDADSDGLPDRAGDPVAVTGVLTSDPLTVGEAAYLVNVQDHTAGLVLFSRDSTVFSGLVRGDSVEATGVFGVYRGLEQLEAVNVRRVAYAGVPEPLDVLARDLRGPRMSGLLVRVRGDLVVTRTEEGWLRAELRDRSGSVPVHISGAWLSDAPFLRRLMAGGSVDVIGIAGQAGATRVEGGDALIPRGREDFGFPQRPPYAAMAVVAITLLIVLLNWWRMREAKRARELARLTSDLRESRDALAAREQRFRSLVEHSADTVSILDPHGRVLYQSPSVASLFGWHAEELVGTSVFDLVHPDDRDVLSSALRSVPGDSVGAASVEVRLQDRSGGWRSVEGKLRDRTSDPAVEGIVCNLRDLTAHRELELRLRRADRMEAVGRLTGGIAHDFNNILTAIVGHADFAIAGLDPEPAARADVEEIRRAADRATSLVRQLLAFSRQQVLNPQVLVPSEVIFSLEPMLQRVIGEDIELTVSAAADLEAAQVDRTQLEQVVVNLVVNARDAMPTGGVLRIHLENDVVTPAAAAGFPFVFAPGAYVRLSVSDTGSGMDEETKRHIFEPFFTTKAPGEGTGLGLATVYGIVKQSGGYIDVRSECDGGTTFDIWLPPCETSPEPTASTEPTRAPAAVDGASVLLVEDDPGVRRLVVRILERNGYTVLVAGGPVDALSLVSGLTEPLDLLLTDVVMPGMSGRELATRVAREQPGLHILFMSGYTEDEIMRRGGPVSGGEDFLPKPFTAEQLLQAVAGAI